MPFGGSKKVKLPPVPAPAPINVQPDIELARTNVRERLLRARGRAASQVTSGALAPPNLLRQNLKERLG